MRTLREIFEQFPAARERGLDHEQVELSLSRYGANRLTPLPREPTWKKFLGKFDEPIIRILLAATLLKTVVDLFVSSALLGVVGLVVVAAAFIAAYSVKLKQWLPTMMFGLAILLVGLSLATSHPSFEGLAVMIAVVLATGVAFLSEYKSDREFEILNTEKESLRAKVLRHGEVHSVAFEDLVVGDLTVLEMGDEVPADGRILKANELHLDQSLLTGESEPVRKTTRGDKDAGDGPEQPGCVYRGTQVADGAGQMVVTEVGDMTMIGQIARRLLPGADEDESGKETEDARVRRKLTVSKEQTPLQEKLAALARTISRVGYVAAIAIFVALLVRGIAVTHEVRFGPQFVVDEATGEYVVGPDGNRLVEPGPGQRLESTAHALRDSMSAVLGYFVYMVIIIVVAVPEGLPMSVTISLALAMRKMTRANSLVRQLVACETIGSATVICSDKTGTLTQNRMEVELLGLGGSVYDRAAGWPKPTIRLTEPADWVVLNSTVNSTANLEAKDGKTVVIGNSTEGALLRWARDAGIEYGERRAAFPLRYQMHFSSERKRMTSVIEREGRPTLLMKGAPEIVLDRCTHQLNAAGEVIPLASADREKLAGQVSDAAGRAMRTLAFAHRDLPADTPCDEDSLHDCREQLEHELVFDGFVAIRDPIRPEVPDAIQKCRSAGIDVKMITGDNIRTARAIAGEIGLLDSTDAIAITSDEFNSLSDDDVKERLPRMRILARARPLDKHRMVRLLQDQGHVVAVTGDGTNDAPALKKADVGLAMGIAGTEVAKEASKIVLLDDSFATIVKAVHWGRALYENIQRFLQFQLTINVSALAIAFLGPFLNLKPPFTVLQLLWINVIMDTFAAIALCSEPPREGLLCHRPKRRDENIISRSMRLTIFTTAGFFVVVMLGLLVVIKGGWLAAGSGPNPERWEFSPLNVRQVTLFFTIYVLFQVWNQINCRSLSVNTSGFHGIWRNPTFLGIMAVTLVGQLLIVTFAGAVFAVEPLGVADWLLAALVTSSVLVFAESVRQIRKSLR
jgi:Ca2+-transporting ATPase